MKAKWFQNATASNVKNHPKGSPRAILKESASHHYLIKNNVKNAYVALLIPINYLLNANYFYLMSKPINPSILDFFGPWPVYILVAETLVIGFFALAMIPVFLAKKFVSASKS